jgi:hypothetical protein
MTVRVAEELVAETAELLTMAEYCPAWDGVTFGRLSAEVVAPGIRLPLKSQR